MNDITLRGISIAQMMHSPDTRQIVISIVSAVVCLLGIVILTVQMIKIPPPPYVRKSIIYMILCLTVRFIFSVCVFISPLVDAEHRHGFTPREQGIISSFFNEFALDYPYYML